jgi:hypothetical protein
MDLYANVLIKGKRFKRSRFIMEAFLNRKLEPDEVVHHINGNKRDDRIENLKVMNYQDHISLHHAGLKQKGHPAVNRLPLEVQNNLIREFERERLSSRKVNFLALERLTGVCDCCIKKRYRNYVRFGTLYGTEGKGFILPVENEEMEKGVCPVA